MLRSVPDNLTAQVCLTGLAAFCLPACAGNHAPAEAADDNEAISPVAPMWRSLTLSHGSTRHHYREPDPLGRVDPLDSETGTILTTQATLRWRGKLAQTLPTFTLQSSL